MSAGAADTSMLIRIGTVVRAHGLGGELKVRPETDDPSRFRELKAIYIGADGESAAAFSIQTARLQPTRHGVTVLLGVAGIGGRDEAERYRTCGVYAREDDLPALDDDEWFLDDLVGMEVTDANGNAIGSVREVIEIPSHPLLAVRRPDGREGLIPAVSPFLLAVDLERGTIEVDLPDGLLDP